MSPTPTETARDCMQAAYAGTLDFPSIVRTLIAAGFEGYDVDYRRHRSSFFQGDGACIELTLPASAQKIAAGFDAKGVERAVREAQSKAPGYTYAGFCAQVMAAGCAGYMVSFSGRRALYFGRTGETHVEYFPGSR